MKKQSLILSVILLSSCSLFPQEDKYPFSYQIIDEEAVIIRLNEKYQTSLKTLQIPSYIDGYPVTEIRSHAFIESAIEEVIFEEEENLHTIGQGAFESCEKLQYFAFPRSLEAIGQDAFAQCYELEHLDFTRANKLKFIGSGAFYGDEGLGYLDLPMNLVTLGDEVFYDCNSLIEVHIYDKIEIIGMNAFCNDTHLTIYFHDLLTIPDGFSSDWNHSDQLTDTDSYEIPYVFIQCNHRLTEFQSKSGSATAEITSILLI